MTKSNALWFLLGLSAAVLVGPEMRAAEEPEVGKPAPAFSLQGSDGKTHTLADLKGKPVVLAWFPKAFTGGCTAECKSFKENGQALKALNVAYFTASTDDAETNKKFAESLGLDYPILSDPGKDVAKSYGVLPEGREVPVRWTFYIDENGVLKHVDKMIKTQTSGADVAKKLKDLGLAD